MHIDTSALLYISYINGSESHGIFNSTNDLITVEGKIILNAVSGTGILNGGILNISPKGSVLINHREGLDGDPLSINLGAEMNCLGVLDIVFFDITTI